LSGKTKHGCTQTLFYIIIIQNIGVGPTKVDLNTHDIRLGRIYFHSTLFIRFFGLNAESLGTLGIIDGRQSSFFAGKIDAVSLPFPPSILP